jgi:hypothetical protein
MLEAWLFRRELLSTGPGVHAGSMVIPPGITIYWTRGPCMEAWLFRRELLSTG